MKERPILYSSPMVLALRAGRKTQTRRVCKVQPAPWKRHHAEGGCHVGDWKPQLCENGEWELSSGFAASEPEDVFGRCPYGKPGDRLWGRETFSTDALGVYPCPRVWYRADFTKYDDPKSAEHERDCDDGKKPRADCFACARDRSGFRWKPSIFMPRWASRLLHEVMAVRIERLLDITEADAIAEGLERRKPTSTEPWGEQWVWQWPGGNTVYPNARSAYLAGWDTINGKGSAAKSPWVWAIEFRPVPP